MIVFFNGQFSSPRDPITQSQMMIGVFGSMKLFSEGEPRSLGISKVIRVFWMITLPENV